MSGEEAKSLSSWACSSSGHLRVIDDTSAKLLNVESENPGFLKDTYNSSSPAELSASGKTIP